MKLKNIRFAVLLTILLPFTLACNHQQVHTNRLAKAASPYLRQHADNPVDWYEWGGEALDKAKALNKPLLISIGYAACHWCHQMEKESFMDTAVARLMNDNFICIKVDREERPDIDDIYLHACQLLNNGNAGWPLNAFALPDGKPFFAGTYYSKENWITLLQQVSDTYKNKHSKVILQANALTFGIIDNDSLMFVPQQSKEDGKNIIQHFYQEIYQRIDLVNGGLKGQQKFPVPSLWEFLLEYHYFTNEPRAIAAVNNTLASMAFGGIYDQVGGGFSRYSTDSMWRVPHFEKMLYDNAQLISLYVHAYQVTKQPLFKKIAIETMAFVDRELTSSENGFYASLNADTKEGEGEFYKWKSDEFETVLGKQNSKLLQAYFHVSQTGNDADGKNILYATQPASEFAAANGLTEVAFEAILQEARSKLLAARNKRPQPTVDGKILTAWNALMLQALVDAYTAFGEPALLEKAKANALFLKNKLYRGNGRLWRNYLDGKASTEGFLIDYALLAQAYIRLYEISFEKDWLMLADQLTAYAVKQFFDKQTGFFYFSGSDAADLPVQKIEMLNNVIPPSNAVMADVLIKLATLLGNDSYEVMASAMLEKMSGQLSRVSVSAPAWAAVFGKRLFGMHEVAVMGADALVFNKQLQQHYLPDCVFMGGTIENLPLLENKLPASGTLIYVCTNKSCKRPVGDVRHALEQLK